MAFGMPALAGTPFGRLGRAAVILVASGQTETWTESWWPW